MIPEQTIDQIREAADIVQIIGEFLRLKKRGRNYLANCPFHTEKTPSFTVSQDKQIYHCFGCGKGGNVFTFLMEHEKMSFVEAVRYLAKKTNITIVEERTSDYKRELLDRLNYAMTTANEFFQKNLFQSRYKKVLDSYLKGRRNISDEAIKYFQLGLAGEEWDGLIKYAAAKDISTDDLDSAGLVIYSEKNKNYFDRFRHRLMIPIMNLSGKVIAFGGRTLKKGEPAKYMNSPETKLYSKSNVLYNLNLAKDEIRNSGSVIIVEGYFDVISLWEVGIKNVVASSGTAFTPQQARLLARFAEEVYLFFDADSAGKNAALKSVDALYDAGLEVKIIVPPESEDPDSLAQKFGRDKIDDLVDDAIGFIPFRIKDFDRENAGIISKEKLIKEFSAIGSKINDPTRRALFFTEAASIMQVEERLFTSIKTPPKEESEYVSFDKRRLTVEMNFISLLFSNPPGLNTVFEKISPDDFDSKQLSRLYQAIIEQYKIHGDIDVRALLDNIKDSEFISLITRIASIEWDKETIAEEMAAMIKTIIEQKKKRIRNDLLQKLKEAEEAGDNEKADKILAELKSFGLNA